jgi:hypothetical protein
MIDLSKYGRRTMAVCGACGGEMMDGVSCSSDLIMIDGKGYEPIRWGEERRSKHWPLPDSCTDCRVPVGGVHHPGCCVERCPGCGGQALGCLCFDRETWSSTGATCGYERARARRCAQHLFLQANRG